MSREVEAVHLLTMAKALEDVNDKAGMLIAAVQDAHDLKDHMDIEKLRATVTRLQERAQVLREAIWPT